MNEHAFQEYTECSSADTKRHGFVQSSDGYSKCKHCGKSYGDCLTFNVLSNTEPKTECPGETGGKHEYQIKDGKELVCRRCNHTYDPPRLSMQDPVFCRVANGPHCFAMDETTAKAACGKCGLPYEDWFKYPPITTKATAASLDPSKIENHEGKKYLRRIHAAISEEGKYPCIYIDVYGVLIAYKVECPAVGHAIKKLLAAGLREKGSTLDDLQGALAALYRAIELQQQREVVS